jgi:hypothetical protein
MVWRLTRNPNPAAKRAPARPAKANPNRSSTRLAGRLCRPYRTVKPGTCSAKVTAGQASVSQNHRRTRSRITSRRPATTALARRRW